MQADRWYKHILFVALLINNKVISWASPPLVMEAGQCLTSLPLGHTEQEESLWRTSGWFPWCPWVQPCDGPRGASLPQRQEAAACLPCVPALCPALHLPVPLRNDDLLPNGRVGTDSARRGSHILDRHTRVHPQCYLRCGHRDYEPHLQICCGVPHRVGWVVTWHSSVDTETAWSRNPRHYLSPESQMSHLAAFSPFVFRKPQTRVFISESLGPQSTSCEYERRTYVFQNIDNFLLQ